MSAINYYRFDIGVLNTSRDAARDLLETVTGNAAEQGSFEIARTVAGSSGYFTSVVLTEAQRSLFLAGAGTVTLLLWYETTHAPNGARTLLGSNSPTAQASIGSAWTIAQSLADMAIPITIVEQATVWASPTGSVNGAGTESDPVTLVAALTGFPIKATNGGNIYLKAGQYILPSSITTATYPNVVVQPAPSVYWRDVEIIALGNISIATPGMDWLNLHVRGNPPYRRDNTCKGNFDCSQPIPDFGYITLTAPDVRLRNVWHHDLFNFASQQNSPRGEIIECVSYNYGWVTNWYGSDDWHGHLFYGQHGSYDNINRKKVIRCIFGQTGGSTDTEYGIHWYGGSGSNLAGLDVVDCVHAFCKMFIGGYDPVYDLLIDGAEVYKQGLGLGYSGNDILGGAGPVEVRNSYFRTTGYNVQLIRQGNQVNIHDNIFDRSQVNGPCLNPFWNAVDRSGPIIDNNDYYTGHAAIWHEDGVQSYTLAQARALGYEAGGTKTASASPDRTRVIPCVEGNNEALIAVYNHNVMANNVNVNIAALDLPADTYRLQNPFNYAEYQDVVYNGGGTLVVPMTGWTAAPAINSEELVSHITLDKAYMAFVLESLV